MPTAPRPGAVAMATIGSLSEASEAAVMTSLSSGRAGNAGRRQGLDRGRRDRMAWRLRHAMRRRRALLHPARSGPRRWHGAAAGFRRSDDPKERPMRLLRIAALPVLAAALA